MKVLDREIRIDPRAANYSRDSFQAIPKEFPHVWPTRNKLLLASIGNPNYQLSTYIQLIVSKTEHGKHLVTDAHSEFNVYGVGNKLDDAVDEFVSMMLDLYEELVDSEPLLSRNLRSQLRLLRQIISPRT